jgi:anti-sigma regulatory factor (Ser/Thr protein kinase)
MTLELKATPEEVMRAVEALQEFGEARQIPAEILFGLTLALEECGSNIVNHGLLRNPERTFRVSFEHSDCRITIELRDPGPEFDPTRMPAGDLEAADDTPPGGWGILLVRRYTDEIHYARAVGENVLRLTKNLGVPPSTPNL